MKKYIIFSISFIAAFTLLQVVSGIFITVTYMPDMEVARNMGTFLSQETFIVGSDSSLLPAIFIAFLSASIAYIIPNKFTSATNNVK